MVGCLKYELQEVWSPNAISKEGRNDEKPKAKYPSEIDNFKIEVIHYPNSWGLKKRFPTSYYSPFSKRKYKETTEFKEDINN